MNPVRAWAHLVALTMLTIAVAGCQFFEQPSMSETPFRAIAATAVAVESVAESTIALHEQGLISDAQRADIKVKLQDVLDGLRDAEAAVRAGRTSEAEDTLGRVESVLRTVRTTLTEAT